MPNTNTVITFKRSSKSLTDLLTEKIEYGEPIYLEVESKSGKNRYLAIGNNLAAAETETTIDNATIFEGITDKSLIGKTVYANSENVAITQDNNYVDSGRLSPIKITSPSTIDAEKYYLVSCDLDDTEKSAKNTYVHSIKHGVYLTGNGVLVGGAWNDYAERRQCTTEVEPGYVVCEQGDGTLALASEKYQACPYVVSDTYGMIIGEEGDNYYPLAVSGRVLVYVDCSVKLGDVLCANKNGKATKMNRSEIVNCPDRILGVVSEIPTYDKWNDIEVNGRVWIKLR